MPVGAAGLSDRVRLSDVDGGKSRRGKFLAVGEFEQQRGEQGGDYDEYEHERHYRGVDKPGVHSALRTHHHSYAHPQTVLYAVAAYQRARAAAHDLAKHPRQHEHHTEARHSRAYRLEGRGDADVGEEYGGENHIIADFYLAVDVFRLVQTREHKPRDVCARYVRHSKPRFRRICVKETYGKTEYGNAAGVRIFLRDVFEGKPDEYADGYRRGEEGYHHPDGTPYIARTASGVYADEQREQHDAYHIVDYGGGNDEREQTLNQLLAEMDGFESNKGLVLLAATNRPEILDPALLRPGRFDRRIIVEKPDLKGRVEVLKVHSKDVKMDETVNLEEIALATSGAVGSDLANMINEAAINAVKKGRNVVSQADLFEAVEVVLVGKEKKDRIMNAEERRIVSYHEVGHALVSALQKDAEPVQKITIVPRTMGALGYTMQVPEEEKYLMSKEQMLSELVTLFGGRAAEEVVFNSVTTGASNDIERATQIARAMVTQYGMSERFGLMGLESVQNRYLDGRAVMNCSDATGALIDEEVKEMLKVAYDKAKKIIEDHREVMDEIAEFLIEKETITGKEFMKIFRAVEKGMEIPENLDELDFSEPEKKEEPTLGTTEPEETLPVNEQTEE